SFSTLAPASTDLGWTNDECFCSGHEPDSRRLALPVARPRGGRRVDRPGRSVVLAGLLSWRVRSPGRRRPGLVPVSSLRHGRALRSPGHPAALGSVSLRRPTLPGRRAERYPLSAKLAGVL